MPTKEKKQKTARQLLKQLDISKRKKTVTVFSKAVADKILLLVRQGAFYRDAAFALGLDEETSIIWVQDNPEFARDVYKYRFQAIVDVQKNLWRKALSGDLNAMLTFLKAVNPEKWNTKALEQIMEGKEPDKIIFVDRILEEKKDG